MNPYTLIRHIKKLTGQSAIPCASILGSSEKELGINAERFLRLVDNQCRINPEGSTAEFAGNLNKLLAPGSDSRIYLAASYAGLEGMFNEIMNMRDSCLKHKECQERIGYDELLKSPKFINEVFLPYSESVRRFNPQSALAETAICMAIIDECRKVWKTVNATKNPNEKEKILIEQFNTRLNEYKNAFLISGKVKLTPEEEEFLYSYTLISQGIYQFYRFKLSDQKGNLSLAKRYKDFQDTHLYTLIKSAILTAGWQNTKDFAMKINLFFYDKPNIKEKDFHQLQDLIETVCEYRNKLNHGVFHNIEVKERLCDSKSERKRLEKKRKQEHSDAVSSMLTLLLILAKDVRSVTVSEIKVFFDKMAYYALYGPLWLLNHIITFSVGSVVFLITKLFSIAVFIGIIYFIFTNVGRDMTPKYMEPKDKIEAFDAMIDGDTTKLIMIRDRSHFNTFTKSTQSTRDTKPANQTTWRLLEKPKKEFKNGRILHAHPRVDFFPMQSSLDSYMKVQLQTLANELSSFADGNTIKLGIAASSTSIELEHDPLLTEKRYAAVESFLRSILPENVTIERLERKEHHVSLNFYLLPNQ